jgi:hypothetical protein
MTKIKMLAAAVAVASVSTLANANPPAAPEAYNNGPFSPFAITALSPQERVAYALLEGIMQSVEGKVHAAGCSTSTLGLKVLSDAGNPVDGTATLGQSPNSLVLSAVSQANTFAGQKIQVDQVGVGYIAGTEVNGYASIMTYNSANNMMTGIMSALSIMDPLNWSTTQFTGKVIKDFYMGQNDGTDPNKPPQPDTHIVYDWGLQSLDKEMYPVEKWWQRSKVRRSNGGMAYTAFVKDRLVGVTPCRITVELQGLNQSGIFQQGDGVYSNGVKGTVKITQDLPGDSPVAAFDNIPNI